MMGYRFIDHPPAKVITKGSITATLTLFVYLQYGVALFMLFVPETSTGAKPEPPGEWNPPGQDPDY